MSEEKKLYLAMKIKTDFATTEKGLSFSAKNEEHGIEGVCLLFNSPEAAKEFYGDDVNLFLVKLKKKEKMEVNNEE